ncbi:MAG: hypothetical protein EXR79_16755 [Myxococcales bacterium]|nr:hypothetical protein [Myxococcales bacterium]
MPHLVEQAGRVMGSPVETMLGDGRYNTGQLHELAKDQSFELLALSNATSMSRPTKETSMISTHDPAPSRRRTTPRRDVPDRINHYLPTILMGLRFLRSPGCI